MNMSPFLSIRTKLSLAISLCFCLTACGDMTSGAGEFGRVIYSLYTHYVVEESVVIIRPSLMMRHAMGK